VTATGDTPRFRRARRDDLAAIVRLLADHTLGATRETTGGELSAAYGRALEGVDADPRQLLVVAELDGRVVGTLQLSFIPSLTYQGGERAQIDAVRVEAASRDSVVCVEAIESRRR
jgi:hypothetical protein